MKDEIKNRIDLLRERQYGYRDAYDLQEENNEKLEFLEKLYEALYL